MIKYNSAMRDSNQELPNKALGRISIGVLYIYNRKYTSVIKK